MASAKTAASQQLGLERKKTAAAPWGSGRQQSLPRLRRGEGQATRVLNRPAFAVARFEIGWKASPASLTIDSVSLDVLADRTGAFAGDAAGFDHRFDVRTGEIGELFGDLLATLGVILAALIGAREHVLERGERRDGVEALEEVVVHGLNPFLGR